MKKLLNFIRRLIFKKQDFAEYFYDGWKEVETTNLWETASLSEDIEVTK